MSLLDLLSRKPEKQVQPADATGDLSQPPYYEAWGGLERANRALWAGLWFAGTALLLCIIVLRIIVTKPPVVIRVESTGSATAIRPADLHSPVSGAEVKNFLALFERFYFGLNVYTHEENLNLAFSMMTPAFQKKANESLQKAGTVDILKAERQRIRVLLGQLDIVRETDTLLECRIKGTREVGSFSPEKPVTEVIFEHTAILRKVPRSAKAPYGVLVEDLRESLYKS